MNYTSILSKPMLFYTRCPLPTALSLAFHGIADDGRESATARGYQLASLKASPDPAVRLSHFTHEVAGQIRHGGNAPPIWARATGRDVRLLGLSWSREGQLILIAPDSALADLRQLKGKRLGLPKRPRLPIDHWRSSVLRGYEQSLEQVGLGLCDVTLVDILIDQDPAPQRTGAATALAAGAAHQTLSSQSVEARALLRGEVDAIFSPAHYGAALRRVIGAKVLYDLSQLDDPLQRLNNFSLLALTVEGGFLDRHPDLVVDVLSDTLRAAAQGAAHPEKVARIVGAESGNAEELIPEIFAPDFAVDLAPRLDDLALEGLALQTDFLHRHGFIPRRVDPAEWVEPTPLADALQQVQL